MSRRRTLSRFLAALTTGTTALAVAAVAPAAAAAPPGASRQAGALAGDEAWYTTEAEAMAAARQSGERIEVDGLTTETQQVFANPGGTFTLEQRVRPVRVKRNGRWTAVDTTLDFDTAGRVAPRNTKVGLSFSGGGDSVLVRLDQEGKELALGWKQPLPRPTLDGDTATYRNVLPDVDLVVKADVEGFSEVFVVHTPEAAANPELATTDFALSGKGLSVTTDSAGNIKALDSDGREVFVAPTPRMWDSAGTPDPDLTAGARAFQSNQGAKQAIMTPTVHDGTLSITPDQEMLTSASTKYPVYLDPTLVAGSRLAWTSVWKSFPTSKYWNSTDIARVGHSDEDNLTNRSFFRMDTSRVKGKNIIRATFQAHETHSWSCSARSVELWRTGAISSSTTWNSQPSWIAKLATVNVAKGYSSSCPDGGVDFDATAGVRTSAAAGAGDVTLGLRATSETDTFAWKKFRNNPTLSIEYNSTPSVPTNLSTSPGTSCTGGKIGNTDVTLRAVPSDADGGNVIAEFSFWPTGGATTVRNVTVSSGIQASTVFVKSGLVDGTTYNWKVRTKDSDGAGSGYSTTCSFKVDRTLPSADVDVTSTQYPAQDPEGTIVSTVPAGTPGQFTLNAKGNTDVIGFYVGLDTDTPTRYVAANTPGGTATLTMTPTHSGPGYVAIKTWDGVNPSATIDSDYSFFATAPVGPPVGRNDLNTDNHGDIIGRTAAGDLCLYLGDGTGGFLDGGSCSLKIDSNRQGWLHVVRPGDWDGDGWTDLVAVEADGDLVYFSGTGAGSFLPDANDVIIDWDANDNPIKTTGWNQYNLVVAPGDWDGDTYPDLIARKTTGEIVLHRGNGFGGWADDAAPIRLGWGIWQGYDALVAPGDVDGDGKPDLFARKSTGELTLFRGNGKAGFRSPGGVKYGIWQTGVNVRAANTTCDASPSVANCPTVIDTLNPGDLILPICQKAGESIGGNPYWVYGTTPRGKTGWFVGYYVDYTDPQLPDVPNCTRPAQTTYTVWTDGVNVAATNATCEASPSTTNCATTIDTLNTGSMFTPICQRTGQTISGNPYWVYGISSNGQTGWMPAWWMDYPDNRLPNLAICGNYNGTSAGTGWNTYSAALFSPGDFNDDGKNDLLGVKSTGDLHIYYGTGNSTNLFTNGNGETKIGSGWTTFNKLF
ncbi:FG-GAP-like repeat-containing protein [Micromonospora sp. NPDC093277]|uniref:FG-GAP-like repeat-containing protein n=1 Tax=Micromonospora sp. NPDC093277 TaxID=3364291 RepID=UPI003818C18C